MSVDPGVDWLRPGSAMPRQLFKCLTPGCDFETYDILKMQDHQKLTRRYKEGMHRFEGVFIERET